MFKVIVLDNGEEKELDHNFETEIEAEFYMEGFDYEAYKIVPVNS